jgi:alpha-D-ribose 1-methylphosphonate 5-phosphate C-P lyase
MKSGSVPDLQNLLLRSFAALDEQQKQQIRRAIYLKVVGKELS